MISNQDRQLTDEALGSKNRLIERAPLRELIIKIEKRTGPNGGRRLGHKPSQDKLKGLYSEVTRSLNQKYETQQTSAEKKFGDLLRRTVRFSFHQSFWIGNHNCDFFFPGVSAVPVGRNRTRGLVVEIDGEIHHTEGKIRKDEQKTEFLKTLGIMVTSIRNEDVFSSISMTEIDRIGMLHRTGSRERLRLYRSVFVETMVAFLPETELVALYSLPQNWRAAQ